MPPEAAPQTNTSWILHNTLLFSEIGAQGCPRAMAGHGRPSWPGLPFLGQGRPRQPGTDWPDLAGLRRPRPAMDHQGRPGTALAGHGRPWPAVTDHGRSWPAAGLGRPRAAMASHGRHWPASATPGWPSPAMADHGRPWPAMANRSGLAMAGRTAHRLGERLTD